jgi:membrane-bound serine protease (ClpP class)
MVLALDGAGGATAAPTPVIVAAHRGHRPASEDFVERGLIRAEKDGRSSSPRSTRRVASILDARLFADSGLARSGGGVRRTERCAGQRRDTLYASHVAGWRWDQLAQHAGGHWRSWPDARRTVDPGKEPDAASPRKPSPGDHGGTMARKWSHDAAAYLRGLAQLRGRNVEWRRRAVREP